MSDSHDAPAPGGPRSAAGAEEIERDIERTRAQLGQTAGALAHRLSPKTQAKEQVQAARERPQILVGVVAALVLVLVAVVLRRRRG